MKVNNLAALALLVAFVAMPIGCGFGAPPPPPPQTKPGSAVAKLEQAATEQDRFYALNKAAKESFELGKIEDARKYAADSMALLPKFRGDWNYGNAVHDANLVLGRIAVKEGRIDDAKKFLLAAGRSPGSPQMNSFGPNMTLARDLLQKNEKDVVIQYFDLCRSFWKMERGRLGQWTDEAKAGKVPDFGANLHY